MSEPGIAVFGYGVLLNPEQLSQIPWREEPWGWELEEWIKAHSLFEEQETPKFSMFTVFSNEDCYDKTSALISSYKWHHTLLYSWEAPAIVPSSDFQAEPDPAFEDFVRQYLPFVEYAPNWYLVASRG